ncbi:MAG TPA: macro domain-containing protein [Thermoanaerobaculia bacterium]|nr:macro domain-containing protein [Thermoanaerobaculia bacterium]
MEIDVFEGDLTEARADAVCTSTNPRLSLMMGTGGAVRERGGFEVLRQCEAIAHGKPLPPGSAHVTTAGSLPFKIAIHCVASNEVHLTSNTIIRACVRNALVCAGEHACRSLVMPVFGTGHARFKFQQALEMMLDVLQNADTPVQRVTIAINDAAKAESARRLLVSTSKARPSTPA